ncbi:MAG TPA: endonuclease MutS2, partial [Bryobacteraceae bacterium]|nr:endonuclease MutS2 [Bryobacteraceae bacterium]
MRLRPIARIDRDLAEAGEGIAWLRAAGQGGVMRIQLSGLPDVSLGIQKLRIEGATLDPPEIFGLIQLLDRAADAKSSLSAAAERFPLLGA